MGLCRNMKYVITLLIIILIAVGIGYVRNSIINIQPKPNGFVLSTSSSSSFLKDIKNVLLVGGTNGIGKALAISFLEKGYIKVTIIGRTKPNDILENPEFLNNVKFIGVDLSSMVFARDTVRLLKDEKFDIIVFTQGISPLELFRTSEGIESDLAVSYLSRYVMIKELIVNGLDKIQFDNGRKPRVFIMGAPGLNLIPLLDDPNWEKSYKSMDSHLNTHVFNEALVPYFTNKYPSIQFFGLNPGIVVTDVSFDRLNGMIKNKYVSFFVEKLLKLLFPYSDYYTKDILLPLLSDTNIKSGSLFNQRGDEILPGPWFRTDIDSKVNQVISMSETLLNKVK